MAVTKKPEVFRTSDGREFADGEDAERHETLIAAVNEFEKSRENLLCAMAHTNRTADGELMDPTQWGTYYQVLAWAHDPHVTEVSFYYSTEIQLDGDRLYLVTPWLGKDRDSKRYLISELYAHKTNADRALRVLLEERAVALQKRIESLPAAK